MGARLEGEKHANAVTTILLYRDPYTHFVQKRAEGIKGQKCREYIRPGKLDLLFRIRACFPSCCLNYQINLPGLMWTTDAKKRIREPEARL